jgi:hypothetical protein
VIDSPDSVSLVTPPKTTIQKTNPAQKNSHQEILRFWRQSSENLASQEDTHLCLYDCLLDGEFTTGTCSVPP